jgi:hypothetical protein
VWIERPALRPYFYEGKDHSSLPSEDRDRLLAAAEFFTDFLENIVVRCWMIDQDARLKNATPIDSDAWRDYARNRIAVSPAIQAYMRTHIDWYAPSFVKIWREATTGLDSPQDPSVPGVNSIPEPGPVQPKHDDGITPPAGAP